MVKEFELMLDNDKAEATIKADSKEEAVKILRNFWIYNNQTDEMLFARLREKVSA